MGVLGIATQIVVGYCVVSASHRSPKLNVAIYAIFSVVLGVFVVALAQGKNTIGGIFVTILTVPAMLLGASICERQQESSKRLPTQVGQPPSSCDPSLTLTDTDDNSPNPPTV